VIADTNHIKKEAIAYASCESLTPEKQNEFIHYFTRNNGIPREIKINQFFEKKASAKKVLQRYNDKLEQVYYTASLTLDIDDFLHVVSGRKLFILSGGDQKEVSRFARQKGIGPYFEIIMGGPSSKEENIRSSNFKGKSIYIGDSKIDHEIAIRFAFDFIFMYGYTQFSDWKQYFCGYPNVTIIKNFSSLL